MEVPTPLAGFETLPGASTVEEGRARIQVAPDMRTGYPVKQQGQVVVAMALLNKPPAVGPLLPFLLERVVVGHGAAGVSARARW